MFLRNHGLVILGETIEEAFSRACNTVLACEAQVRMMPVGIDNLVLISDEAKRRSQVYILDDGHGFFTTPDLYGCFYGCVGSGEKSQRIRQRWTTRRSIGRSRRGRTSRDGRS